MNADKQPSVRSSQTCSLEPNRLCTLLTTHQRLALCCPNPFSPSPGISVHQRLSAVKKRLALCCPTPFSPGSGISVHQRLSAVKKRLALCCPTSFSPGSGISVHQRLSAVKKELFRKQRHLKFAVYWPRDCSRHLLIKSVI
jgi:hypothetical protein